MNLTTLNDVLLHELQDLYSVEKQLAETLPKISKTAYHLKLIEALDMHFAETKNHLERLQEISQMLGKDLDGQECKGMKGILEEGKKVLSANGDSNAIDAAIISAVQKAEHYEIATYGSAVAMAEALELDAITSLLQQTLDEEGEANKKLTSLAQGSFFTEGINLKSANRSLSDELSDAHI